MPELDAAEELAPEYAAKPKRKLWTRSAYQLFVVAALTIAVKIVGAGKSAVSARLFGIGHELDCYLTAFALVSLVCEISSGSLTPALIPALARARAALRFEHVKTSYGRILYTACLALTATGVLVVTIDRLAFRLLASGFAPADLSLTHRLLILLFPLFPCTAIAGVWRALLNHEERFALTACAPALTPALAVVFVLAGAPSRGIEAFASGTSAGAVAEVFLLAAGVRRLNFSLLPRCQFRLDRGWLRREYLPMLATNLVGGSRNAVDQAVAATLGAGSISVLNVGTRLVTVATGIGPAAVSTVLLPKLSKLVATGDWTDLRKLVTNTAILGCGVACLVSATAVVLSHPLAYLAFQKGSAHTLDVSLLSSVQAVSFAQLPFAFLSAILARVALSAGLSRSLLVISAAGGVLNVVLDLWLAHCMGVAGIVLATAVLYALTSLALLVALKISAAKVQP